MHRSKQPLHLWFWGAYLVTTHTPGMSALQFARQTGISTYETAFMMLHKLRAAMVREGRDRLRGIVEADESYVGGREAGPGGRGARGKAIVAAAVEVRKDDNGRAFAGRLRLCLIPNVYNGIKALGYRHEPVVEGTPENAPNVLPHVHRVFSNLKSWLIGTHHGVSKQHLQAYLNEYVFRFNRRRTPMAAFQTVLGLIAERVGPTYDGLYGVAKGRKAWRHPAV
jgi:transposase-like protein